MHPCLGHGDTPTHGAVRRRESEQNFEVDERLIGGHLHGGNVQHGSVAVVEGGSQEGGGGQVFGENRGRAWDTWV